MAASRAARMGCALRDWAIRAVATSRIWAVALETASRRRIFSRRVHSNSLNCRASSNRSSIVGAQASTSCLRWGARLASRSSRTRRSIVVGSSSSHRFSSCLRRARYSSHLFRLSRALPPFSTQMETNTIAPVSPKKNAALPPRELNVHAIKAAAPQANRIACDRCRSACFSNSRSSLASVGLFMVFNLLLDALSTPLKTFAMTLPSTCRA